MWEYRHMILEKSIDIWDVNIVCKSNLVLKPTDLPYAHLFRAVSPLTTRACAAPRTVGQNRQNPPKTKFKKFVKSTNHTCACNRLTNFECEAQATGNGSYVNLEKLVKSTYVLADFWHLKPLCAVARVRLDLLMSAWGHRDWSPPNCGSHLNLIPTRGGRLCPPYTDVPTKFWKPQARL